MLGENQKLLHPQQHLEMPEFRALSPELVTINQIEETSIGSTDHPMSEQAPHRW